MRDTSLPITLIVIGVVWLLWNQGWLPERNWVIAGGFIAGGIAVLVANRVTKSSIVTGPLLIAIGIAWALRDAFGLRWTVIIPALLVLLGVLMLVARSSSIPDKRAKPDQPE